MSSTKTTANCAEVGGTVVHIGGGDCLCRRDAATCWAGWTQHQNWSKSVAQTCGDNSSCGRSDGHTPTCACSTRGSEWGNEAPPQCTYYVNAGECTGYQCSAQVTQIGCR